MLKRLLFVMAWLLLTVSITVGITHAQNQGDKPRIVSFTSDTTEVTPAQAESGNHQATLYWETANMTDGYRLDVQVWVLGEWQTTLAVGETLPPSGWELHTVPHTLDFQPPVWRLVILDTKGTIVDQRLLKLRYSDDPDGDPAIVTFEAPTEVPAYELNNGWSYITVTWEVSHRPPNSNLRFLQLSNDAQEWVSIERYRPFLWVRSSGEGMLKPFFVSSRVLNIRIELYDITTQHVYAERHISVLAMGDPNPPTPAPSPTWVPSPSPTARCESDFFFEVPGATYVFSGGGALNGEPFDLCPTSDAILTEGAFQIFENGYMLYRADTNTVYILSNNAMAALVPNTYSAGETITFPMDVPAGTLLPQGIFGKAYVAYYDVAQFLGWPLNTAGEYNLLWQEALGGNPSGVVMTMVDGGRLFVTHSTLGSTPPVWAFINATH